MSRILAVLFVLTFSHVNGQQKNQVASQSNRDPIQGQSIVVKFKAGAGLIPADFATGRVDHAVLEKGIKVSSVARPFRAATNGRIENKSGLDFSRYQLVEIDPTQSVWEVLVLLNDMEEITYAEPLYMYSSEFVPNDFSVDAQREYLEPIRAFEAWDITKGSSDVVIAVIDAAVDYEHEDLKNKIDLNEAEIPDNGVDDDNDGYIDNYYGWDFAGVDFNNIIQDNDPLGKTDNLEHGTWVAGFAAAETNNEIGIAGVGYNSRYMALKCGADNDTRDNGSSFLLNTLEAVIYAADHGADVINMSYGGTTFSQFGQDVMTYAAIEKGVVLVAAAGNASAEIISYPAGYEHVISVGATDEDDVKTGFSNYGTWVDLSAPGETVLSTGNNDGYQPISGTSFSSPIVAGAAGLLIAKYPDFSPFQISQLLVQSTDFIDSVNSAPLAGKLGSGRLNIERALTIAVPAFELLDFTIENDQGNKPERGETGQIDVVFRNSLFNSSSSAQVSVYLGDSSDVIIQNSSIQLGVVGTGEEVALDNIGTVNVASDEIYNKTIPFAVVFEDSTFNYKDSINLTIQINPLKTKSKATPYLLTDGGDFETSLDDFASAALIGNLDVWELGVPGNVLTETNSGLNAWKTLLNEDLPKDSYASVLQSPVFDFSNTTKDYRLSFYKSMESEFCNAPSAVQMQYTLDGSTWHVLGRKEDAEGTNWYNKAPDDDCAIDPSIIPGQIGWLGNFSNEYTEYNISFLSGNSNVTFRYVLFVSGVFNGEPDDGFMIDDFQIEARDPVASFASNRKVIYTGESISFKYLSGGADTFSWNFGDGGTSEEQAPSHTYNQPGIYDVTLGVTSTAGAADTTVSGLITVLPNLSGALSAEAGGDFESNQGYFGAENIAGSGFTLGSDTIQGKQGTASGANAWVIALGQEEYADESEAYLYTPNFNFEFIGSYELGFKSNYAFEDTWDGFIVEYSLNKGSSWTKLNNEVDDGWYNTISNPQAVFGESVPMFSGNSGGEYETFQTDVSFLSGQPNVAFRFVFLTDQNTVDVGMALDDFFVVFPQTGALNADFEVENYEGCAGQEVTFRSTSTGSISNMNWDFGQNASLPTASGPGPHEVSYDSLGVSTVTLAIAGLGTTDIKQFEVLSGPQHTPSFTYTFNGGGNADLVSSEGDTYQWLLDGEVIDGANGQTYEATERGRYAVQVTIQGCPRISPINAFIVTDLDDELPFNIYPNPTSEGKLFIEGLVENQTVLTVFDVAGKVWASNIKFDTHKGVIDLSALPAGNYILSISTPGKSYEARLIVQ